MIFIQIGEKCISNFTDRGLKKLIQYLKFIYYINLEKNT